MTHGDWKIQIKQDDASGTPQTLDHTFTVDPAPTIVNPLALNQRRQILT
ncbi:hypothetical protein KA405_02365 [Patescibacteria group bacterium]|nr:hypothetical protein [Patescibacteria group bacterium]